MPLIGRRERHNKRDTRQPNKGESLSPACLLMKRGGGKRLQGIATIVTIRKNRTTEVN